MEETQLAATVVRERRRSWESFAEAWRDARPALAIFTAQKVVVLVVIMIAHGGDLIETLYRWDANWMLSIIEDGYTWPVVDATGTPVESNLAFLPFLPMAGSAVARLTPLGSQGSMLLVAWIGTFAAAWGIYALGKHFHGRGAGVFLVAIWGLMPNGLAQVLPYTEGIFVACCAWGLYALLTDRPVVAGILAMVAGLTRTPAVTLIVTVIGTCLVLYVRSRRRGGAPDGRLLAAAAIAPVGFIGFLIFVAVRTGDLTGYLDVQEAWGTTIGSPIDTWRVMYDVLFGSVDERVRVFAVVVAITIIAYVVFYLRMVPERDYWLLSVFCGLVILLTLSTDGFFNSKARFLLPAFAVFLPLARAAAGRHWTRTVPAVALLTLLSAGYAASLLDGTTSP